MPSGQEKQFMWDGPAERDQQNEGECARAGQIIDRVLQKSRKTAREID